MMRAKPKPKLYDSEKEEEGKRKGENNQRLRPDSDAI
jgi:hypothetical protein